MNLTFDEEDFYLYRAWTSACQSANVDYNGLHHTRIRNVIATNHDLTTFSTSRLPVKQ